MNQSTKRRVFQVATGNVGSEMVARLRDHPDLELVGVHCYSVDKVGRDAGEIVGIGLWASWLPGRWRRSSPPAPTA